MRLKKAQACYEIVPQVIMTPFLLQFMKYAAGKPMNSPALELSKFGALALFSYIAAIGTRDVLYWPLVAQVYAEVNRLDIGQAYQARQAISMLSAMQI